MKIKHISASSKQAQRYINLAKRNMGTRLEDVYFTFSERKVELMAMHWDNYFMDPYATNFRIVACNSYNFTVCWDYKNSSAFRIENTDNAYIIS